MTQKNVVGGCAYVICVSQNLQNCVDFVRKGYPCGLKSDLQALIETANTPIIGTDADGLVVEWNPAITMLSGIARDEMIGRNFIQVRPNFTHALHSTA
jgi:PAS domain-containing protein